MDPDRRLPCTARRADGSMTPGGAYNRVIRLSPHEDEALIAEAHRRGMTVSDLVRDVLSLVVTDWPARPPARTENLPPGYGSS